MSNHDELFKNLFRVFFSDLLALTVPRIAADLEAAEPEFLDPELFTAPLQGSRRQVDLAARLRTRSGEPELVVVHVEVEARATGSMERRMLETAVLLRAREGAPVVPIVVYLDGGPAEGVSWEAAADRVAGRTVMLVSCAAFSLPRSRAEDDLDRPEALAWALAGLMSTDWDRPELRFHCMEVIARQEMTEYRRMLLSNCVGRYVDLDDEERGRYEEMIASEQATDVAELEMTWAERLEHEGERKGEARGELRGRQEQTRALLLRLLERRFGPLDTASRVRVQAVTSTEELERMFDRALDAGSLADLGLAD